jgi:hypothetical protein
MTDPILDSDKNVLWKINAQTQSHLPEWIVPIANSRLILSETKHGFLVDCGSDRIVETLKGLYDNGRFVKLDGVFLTHYHDDHTNRIMAVVEAFDCPVYACSNLVDILKHPKAFRLPAMTSIPIPEISVLKHEQQMNWQEFKFTFYNFPGQTIYHDAMLVEHSLEEPIFFIGDSFSPTGIDDYCLLNRNLLHNDKGYFFCLNLLDRFDYRPLLINQHILPLFRFTQQDLHTIRKTLEERLDLLHDLLPWENPNTGIDESWVRLYPYGQDLKSGETFTIECRLYNHSNNTRDFQIRLYLPEGIKLLSKDNSMTIPARTEKNIQFELHAADNIKAGLHVLTADVIFSWWQLTDWCEALIHITPPEQE